MRHGILIILLSISISSSLYGQSIQGKVISLENKLAIPEVEITDDNGQKVEISDFNGFFLLNSSGNYTFEKKGYISKRISIQKSKFILVELHEKPLDLAEVVIKSSHFQSELKEISAAISVISESQINSNDGLNIAPILNSVPGVYMHNGALNTNRITIRGIGSRNLFGTSKIRAYYEDIPLTNGSGETTIEDIELQGIARMEILKGPSSSL